MLTGLAHDEQSHIAYESAINQRAMIMRSRKIAALQKTLKRPEVHGDQEGDMLVVGWGSTRSAIDEAVDRIRKDGRKLGSLCLRFLSPFEPGLREIFSRYKRVMTVEINYSDDPDDRHHRRREPALRPAGVAAPRPHPGRRGLLVPRAGSAASPWMIEEALRGRLEGIK